MSIYDLKGVASLVCDLRTHLFDLFSSSGMNVFCLNILEGFYTEVLVGNAFKHTEGKRCDLGRRIPVCLRRLGDLAKLLTRRGNGASFESPVLKPPENSAELRSRIKL